MIVNILKTLPWYLVGAAVFAVPSILLIIALFAPIDVESNFFATDWVASAFMDEDTVVEDGLDKYTSAVEFNYMFAWLNINLLITTVIFSLGWAIGSHFLNIDEPGKAKFFGITWVILSAVLIAVLWIVNLFILELGSTFYISQYITTGDSFKLMISTIVYYGLMYWLSCILGSARQARSAVLFANQLPARNFL